jgi:hypothetical protein
LQNLVILITGTPYGSYHINVKLKGHLLTLYWYRRYR